MAVSTKMPQIPLFGQSCSNMRGFSRVGATHGLVVACDPYNWLLFGSLYNIQGPKQKPVYSLYNIQGPRMTFWNLMQDDDAWVPFGCPDPDPDPDPGHNHNKAVLV